MKHKILTACQALINRGASAKARRLAEAHQLSSQVSGREIQGGDIEVEQMLPPPEIRNCYGFPMPD